MPRVDFYILSGHGSRDLLRLVCRLADKAYHLGHRVYIEAESPQQAQQLDDLLWTFTPGSFLPHGLAPGASTMEAGPDDHPILIGCGTEPQGAQNVLMNLSAEAPSFFERFERIVEVVEGSEAGRQRGRDHYRFYRERGCALESHTVTQVP